jgi:hypothetical protein
MKAWRIGWSAFHLMSKDTVSGTFPHDRWCSLPFVFCTAASNSLCYFLVTWSCASASSSSIFTTVGESEVLGLKALVTISPAFCDSPNNWVAARSPQLAVNLVTEDFDTVIVCSPAKLLYFHRFFSCFTFLRHIWKWMIYLTVVLDIWVAVLLLQTYTSLLKQSILFILQKGMRNVGNL